MGTKNTQCVSKARSVAWRQSAFTLVELLVVIGIIALLISVLLPALNRARESGNAVKCQANLRTIGQALMMYTNVHKGMMPIGFVFNGQATPAGSTVLYKGENVDWTTLLVGTLKSRKELESSGWDSQKVVGSNNEGPRRMFLCPSNSIEAQANSYKTNYSAHPRLLPDLGTIDKYISPTTGIKTRRIGSVKRSAEIAVIFDGVIDPMISGAGTWNSTLVAFALDSGGIGNKPFMTDDYTLKPTFHSGQPVSMNTYIQNPPMPYNTDSSANAGNIRFRHNNNTGANALMLDGHVQGFKYNKANRTTDLLRGNINVNPG